MNWYLIRIPQEYTQDDFVKVFESESFCQKVYKDEVMEYNREYIPSDVNFNLAWHLKQASDKDIDADEAWDLVSNNGGYTTVAVFDGGFDPLHEDLMPLQTYHITVPLPIHLIDMVSRVQVLLPL